MAVSVNSSTDETEYVLHIVFYISQNKTTIKDWAAGPKGLTQPNKRSAMFPQKSFSQTTTSLSIPRTSSQFLNLCNPHHVTGFLEKDN